MKWLVLILVLLNSVFFVSAQETANTTNETTPIAVPEIVPDDVSEPEIICDSSNCDSECVKCGDKRCHDPGFVCVEDITIERFSPTEISIGTEQITIFLKNTGNVDLRRVYTVISGDGITQIDKTPIDIIRTGDKDFVLSNINASKSGIIDIVIKLYADGDILHKFAEQITVKNPLVVIQKPEYNVTLLSNLLDEQRQTYKLLEKEFEIKNSQGYPVEIVYEKLKETYIQIIDVQSFLIEEDYKKAEAKIEIIKSNLADIKEQLDGSQKKVITLGSKIKNNLLLYGSIAAALVSIFTAYKLVQNSIDKKKFLALHRKIISRKSKSPNNKKHQIVKNE